MQHNSMRKQSFLALIVFLFVCLFSLAGAGAAEAKSVVSNSGPIPVLGYFFNNSFIPFTSDSVPLITDPGPICGTDCGWVSGLSSAAANITHRAQLVNVITGVEVVDGSSLSVGTQIRIEQIPRVGTDISWNGTGHSMDSPYGYWINNADPKPTACRAADFVNADSEFFDIYTLFDVHPVSGVIISPSSNLSCIGTTCTVTASGPVSLGMNFSATYGRFYYRYFANFGPSGFVGCHAINVPMRASSLGLYEYCSGANCLNVSPYDVNFPAQTITFNLTAVGGNTAPASPTITGPITGNTSTPYAFSAQASDPDNDTLRYGIDWDMNSTVDEWAPALGYVASNTAQSTNHSWLIAGPQTFQVLAQDSKGANSTFTSHTITLSAVTNGLCGPASGIATSTSPTLGLCASGTNTPVTGTGPWTWTCLGSGGGVDDLTCNAPYVAPPTLKICENSCDGALDRTSQTFTMAQNTTKFLKACYNTAVACSSNTGDVTAAATWSDTNAPQNIISFPAQGELQAGTPTGTMSEGFTVSYLSETKSATAQVTCVPLTCLSAKSVTDTYCPGETRDTGVPNSCGGTLSCPGTRFCDTNYREVMP